MRAILYGVCLLFALTPAAKAQETHGHADDHSVFSNGGTAIVIHAVSGGTGSAAPARIACAIVTRP